MAGGLEGALGGPGWEHVSPAPRLPRVPSWPCRLGDPSFISFPEFPLPTKRWNLSPGADAWGPLQETSISSRFARPIFIYREAQGREGLAVKGSGKACGPLGPKQMTVKPQTLPANAPSMSGAISLPCSLPTLVPTSGLFGSFGRSEAPGKGSAPGGGTCRIRPQG